MRCPNRLPDTPRSGLAELEMAKAAARSKAAKKNERRKAKKDAVADVTASLASARCPASKLAEAGTRTAAALSV